MATNSANQLDLAETLQRLAKEQQINHIWVEAGATLAGSLIQQQLVDELIVYLALSLWGRWARAYRALGLTKMQDVIELDIQDIRLVGCDIRIVAIPKLKQK